MILHYDEFKDYYEHHASVLSSLHKKQEIYLHEMNMEDIKHFLGANGVKGFHSRKNALSTYLEWIYRTYQVDVVNFNYKIQSTNRSDVEFQEMYFYSYDDFMITTDKLIKEAILFYEKKGENVDFDGFYVFCILEWYGISVADFLSICLDDVKTDKIFVPTLNKTIVLERNAANIINQYKNKSMVLHNGRYVPYKQNTLYRNYKNSPIQRKSIYNIRTKFKNFKNDKRYSSECIYNSGRYYELLKLEKQMGRELTLNDKDLVNQVFNRDANKDIWMKLKDFQIYKEHRKAWED